MLYEIAHIIRDKFGFLWQIVEHANGFLFACRYHKKLNDLDKLLVSLSNEYCIRQTNENDVMPLVKFFNEQPDSAFEFFNPHDFDERSIKKIVRNKAFQSFVVTDGERVLGYFFLRSFFNGKCFRGRMTDYRIRGKGIGKLMAEAMEKVAIYEGLRMFASISPDNLASLESAKAVSEVKVIKTLENGYYYVEVTPKCSLNFLDK